MPDTNSRLSYLEWLDTLSDEEHRAAVERLYQAAQELGVRIDRKPLVTHEFLKVKTDTAAQLLLN
jgi:hypothetical protein